MENVTKQQEIMDYVVEKGQRLALIDEALDVLGFAEGQMGRNYLRWLIQDYRVGDKFEANVARCAKVYMVNEKSVERCCRYAIEYAWENGSIDDHMLYFGWTVKRNMARPSVRHFVATLSYKLFGEQLAASHE